MLSVQTPAGVTYPVRDPLGSATVLTDETRAVVDRLRYDGYGLPADGPPDAPTPAAWAGLPADPTGLYFARARYYDPATGRFLSEDPVPAPNLYAYGLSNPINVVDPTGQQAFVEYQAQTEDDVPQACAASPSIVPLLDWIQLMVDLVDIFTAPGTAVFYSGGNSAAAAQEFARQTGRFTIDMTPVAAGSISTATCATSSTRRRRGRSGRTFPDGSPRTRRARCSYSSTTRVTLASSTRSRKRHSRGIRA